MAGKFTEYAKGIKRLEAAIKGLTKKELDFRPGKGTWSIREVVAHLVDTEIQVYTRYRSILADNSPILVNHDQENWTGPFRHDKSDLNRNLIILRLIRSANYDLIKALTDSDLKKDGIHTTRGRMTVKSLIEAHIRHLDKHLVQIARNRARIRMK